MTGWVVVFGAHWAIVATLFVGLSKDHVDSATDRIRAARGHDGSTCRRLFHN